MGKIFETGLQKDTLNRGGSVFDSVTYRIAEIYFCSARGGFIQPI
jgi:hypothetical protein